MGAPDCRVTSLAVAVSATPVFSACASCGTHGSVDATNVVLWFWGFVVLPSRGLFTWLRLEHTWSADSKPSATARVVGTVQETI